MALTDENGGIGATMLVGPTGYGGGMPYPAYQGGGFGGNGLGGDGWWIILLFILLAGGNWGGNGGFGGSGLGTDFPWLLNGQNGINNNVSDGFRDAQLHDSVTSVRDGVSNLATQLCGCCGDMQMALANGFNGISQQMNANAISDLNRSFASQTATTQGLNALQNQLAQCCCDNRAGLADLRYTVATEACADRSAISDALRDVIAANTASTQRILDQLCQDKIDAKNDTISQLRQELIYARGQASQDVQTATLRAGQANAVDSLYTRLTQCPIPTQPVYGSQPIFTCPNNGCGCNGGF